MKPRELFVVLLRVLGIWELINGCASIAPFLQIVSRSGGARFGDLPQILWSLAGASAIHFVAGAALLWFAIPLSWLFYPSDAQGNDEEPAPPGPLARRLAAIPPQVKLGIGIFLAVVLPITSVALSTPDAPLLITMGTALHTLFLIAIACAAVAYLVRRKWPPIPSFLVMLIAIFALSTLLNAMRRML
ncbi:MAG: hypothetical protein WD845_06410 [Pirellulales bacterium]